MSSQLWPLQMFDPAAEVAVVERKLPHWAQAGTMSFLTWRTFDSLPPNVLRRWHVEREEWLQAHGIDPQAGDWRDRLQQLPRRIRAEFTKTFSERWHRSLDEGHGECILRVPTAAKVVADSLLHFDGVRYDVTDFVVMPNHVHLLAAFTDEAGMLRQCDSWKHFTARELNRRQGRSGRFWRQDGFDHLVRSVEQFELFRRYIAMNPRKAGLRPGEYLLYSKELK